MPAKNLIVVSFVIVKHENMFMCGAWCSTSNFCTVDKNCESILTSQNKQNES